MPKNKKNSNKFHAIQYYACSYLLAIPTPAPSDAIISAIPLPSPVPPPVTRAVLPDKDPSGNSLFLRGA